MNNPFDKESWTEQERAIIDDGGWQCSFCATINANYVTSCACGHNRDDSYENLHGRYVPREDEEYTELVPASAGESAEPAFTEPPAFEEPSVSTEASAVPAFEEPPETPAFEERPVSTEAPSVPAFEEPPETSSFAETPVVPAFEEPPEAPVSTDAPAFTEASAAPVSEEPAEAPAFTETPETSAFTEVPVAPVAEEPATEPEPVAMPAVAPPVKKTVSKTNRPMEEYTEYEQGILNDGGWECAFCERINASYITTCACGHSEDDSFLMRRGKYNGPDAEEYKNVPAAAAAAAAAEATAAAPMTGSAATAAVPAAGSAATASPATATATVATAKPAAGQTPAEMIAEIEKELESDNSDIAKFRAIRKYKNLMKKGYMTKEEFNQKQDALLSFEEEDEMTGNENGMEGNV